MRVIVYVEGPSDKVAMHSLLAPLIERKRSHGVAIDFFESPPGDKKKNLLIKVPKRAANILLNDPDAVVVIMPDLYPKNKGFDHETYEELYQGLVKNFNHELKAKGASHDNRLKDRFKVFCFKHDLEALILASVEALEIRLNAGYLKADWRIPVEDQDHDLPPKRIVERIFRQSGQKYTETVDAPVILGSMQYLTVAERCPQCFKPFVEFIEAVGV